MMKQYFEIKEQYKDTILFFRLGDFYEMFFDDAILVSKELELTLTGRDCGQDERAPMCGVPYHACETYLARLIAKGYKVAICEQMEDPAKAKGLVKRDIIRVVTPGTVIESSMLDDAKNNYIGSIFLRGRGLLCGYLHRRLPRHPAHRGGPCRGHHRRAVPVCAQRAAVQQRDPQAQRDHRLCQGPHELFGGAAGRGGL